jgi:sugar phosphate permease
MNDKRRWLIPLALLLCVVLAFFDKISIAVLFTDDAFLAAMDVPSGKEGLAQLGLLMTVFLLAYGFSSVFLSFIGDLISPVILLLSMMIIWGLLMVLMGMSNSYESMFTYRVLLGIAEGPLFAVAYSIVKKVFSEKEQARATMLWLLGTPIGAGIGFPITAYVLNNYGWRSTFYVLSSITLVVVIVVYLALKNIDFSKCKNSLQHVKKINFSDNIAISKKLMMSASFWFVCFFNIAFLSYLWGLNSWLPSYLKEKGVAEDLIGVYASLAFVGMLIGEVFGSIVSDRFNRRAMMCMISLLGAGLGLLVSINIDDKQFMIVVISLSFMFWGLGAPNVFALLAKVTEARVSATAGGIFNGLGNFASALVPSIIGILVAYTGHSDAGIIFLICMSIVGSAALVSHVRSKI